MKVDNTTIDESAVWEDPSQQHDFFGDVNLISDVVTEVEKDDIIEPKDKKDSKDPAVIKQVADEEEERILNDQFKDFGTPEEVEEEEENDEEDKGTKKTLPSKIGNKQTLEFLKEKGLVTFELEEGEELTEARAEEMLEDTWETSIETGVEEVIKDLPQELKDLIKFSSQGGNVGSMLAKLANNANAGINKSSDITKEATQVLAITMDLQAQGHDQEYIDAQIEFLKSSEKLALISKKSYDKIIAKQESEASEDVIRVTAEREERKKSARLYKNNITAHIGALEEIGGLPVSKADKISLPTYISDPSVELQDGRLVSEFQADLFKVMADKDKVTLLAKLIKSDFDFSAITRKTQTTASREIRQTVQNADKKNIKGNAGVHKPSKKSVWDMLD